MSEWLHRLRHFLIHAQPGDLGRARRLGMGSLRFLWVLGEQFVQDRCLQKTAALTYTSILSLFPLLAVLSIFATHFYAGGEDEAEKKIVAVFEKFLLPAEAPANGAAPGLSRPVPEPRAPGEEGFALGQHIAKIFHDFRKNAGAIAGMGALGLVLSAITLFTATEKFFNEIWRVQAKRPFLHTFSAFASILVCLPALAGAATYASRFFDRQIRTLESLQGVGRWVNILVSMGGKLAPFVLLSLALACALFLIPNTRVHFRSALAGGLLSGLLWAIARASFNRFVGLSDLTRSVLAAFGATLIFLIWLYVLWAIIFLGAEVAYLTQNFSHVLRERFGVLPCHLSDPRLFVLVLGRIGQAFLRNEGGIGFDQLQEQTTLRESDLETLVEDLRAGGFISVREDGRLTVARPLENIRLDGVFALGCCSAALTRENQGEDRLRRALTEMDRALPDGFGGCTLADLLRERQGDS